MTIFTPNNQQLKKYNQSINQTMLMRSLLNFKYERDFKKKCLLAYSILSCAGNAAVWPLFNILEYDNAIFPTRKDTYCMKL